MVVAAEVLDEHPAGHPRTRLVEGGQESQLLGAEGVGDGVPGGIGRGRGASDARQGGDVGWGEQVETVVGIRQRPGPVEAAARRSQHLGAALALVDAEHAREDLAQRGGRVRRGGHGGGVGEGSRRRRQAEDLGQVGGCRGLDQARGKPVGPGRQLVGVGDPDVLADLRRLERARPSEQAGVDPASVVLVELAPVPAAADPGEHGLPLGAGVARRTLEQSGAERARLVHPEVPDADEVGLTGDAVVGGHRRVHRSRLIVPDEAGPHGGAALGEDLRQRPLGQHRLGAAGRQRRHRVLDHGLREDDGRDPRRQPAPEEGPSRRVVTMAVADRVLVGSLQPDQHDVLSLSGRIGPGWFRDRVCFPVA